MLVAAGLKSSISSLINDDVLTFLRRADQHHLGSVSLDDVAEALEEPIRASGKESEEEALRIMVDGTQGYPFMIQLIGHHSWLSAGETITVKDAERGVQRARKRLGALVHGPALSGVSAIDKSFLLAMSSLDPPIRIARA